MASRLGAPARLLVVLGVTAAAASALAVPVSGVDFAPLDATLDATLEPSFFNPETVADRPFVLNVAWDADALRATLVVTAPTGVRLNPAHESPADSPGWLRVATPPGARPAGSDGIVFTHWSPEPTRAATFEVHVTELERAFTETGPSSQATWTARLVTETTSAVAQPTMIADRTPPDAVVTVTPSAAPSGWWLTRPVTATVTAADPVHPEQATWVEACLDGACRVTATVGTVQPNAPGAHVVAATVRDAAGNTRSIAPLTVRIDVEPPQPLVVLDPATPDGDSGWFVTRPLARTHAVDSTSGVAVTRLGIAHGSAAPDWSSEPAERTVPEGRDVFVHGTATDGAGHSATAPVVGPLRVDATPPVASVLVTPSEQPDGVSWLTTPPVAEASAIDAVSGVATLAHRFIIDGVAGAWAPTTAPFAFPDGSAVRAEVTSTDVAGNPAVVTASATFAVDAAPPVPVVPLDPSEPDGANGWYVTRPWVEVEVTDSVSGVASAVQRSTINGAVGPWVPAMTTPREAPQGVMILAIAATDLAGNDVAYEQTTRVDFTRPTLWHTFAPQPADGWNAPLTVTLTSGDTLSGVAEVRYRTQVGTAAPSEWMVYDAPFTLPAGRDVIVHYEATDLAGNVAGPYATPAVDVEAAPPVTTLAVTPAAPGPSGWFTTRPTVTLTATDDASGVAATWFRVNDGAFALYDAPFVLPEGAAVTVTVYSVDGAGNSETAWTSEAYAIDATPPSSVVTSDPPTATGTNGWFVADVTLTFSGADAVSGFDFTAYRVLVDGTPQGDWRAAMTPVTLPDGANVTVDHYGIDAAGNSGDVESVTFAIDATPPAATFTLIGDPGADGWFASASAAMTATAGPSGVAFIEYRLERNGTADPTWHRVAGLVPLPHATGIVFDVHAVNHAGVASPVVTHGPFKNDAVLPTSSLAIVPGAPDGPDGWYTSSPVVTLTASDTGSGLERIEYRVVTDGHFGPLHTPWQAYTDPFAVADGAAVVVEHRAVDQAGNVEAPSGALTVSVDTQAPNTFWTMTPTQPDGPDDTYVTRPDVELIPTDSASGVAFTQYRIIVDGGVHADWATYTGPVALPDGDAVHLEYWSEDVAGHVETVRATPAVKVAAS